MTRPAGPSECTVNLQVLDEGSEMNTPDRRSLLRGCPCLPAIAAVADQANGAEEYPSRPVKIVVPFTAGGLVDVFARVVAEQLQASGAAVHCRE